MNTDKNLEIEIKIRIDKIDDIKKKLKALDFKPVIKKYLEFNIVFDTPDNKLKKKNILLRLRKTEKKAIITFKQSPQKPVESKDYKIREEIEVEVSDFNKTQVILNSLGYGIYFIYEKYREVYKKDDVTVMIDLTPIGDFIEIEGKGTQIDATSRSLGFSRKAYIVDSYYALFRKMGKAGFMLFK